MILAILSLNSEIAIQQDYLESGEVPDGEMDEEQEVLKDLEMALMEFLDAYKQRAKKDKTLPNVDELLGMQAE